MKLTWAYCLTVPITFGLDMFAESGYKFSARDYSILENPCLENESAVVFAVGFNVSIITAFCFISEYTYYFARLPRVSLAHIVL